MKRLFTVFMVILAPSVIIGIAITGTIPPYLLPTVFTTILAGLKVREWLARNRIYRTVVGNATSIVSTFDHLYDLGFVQVGVNKFSHIFKLMRLADRHYMVADLGDNRCLIATLADYDDDFRWERF